MEDNDIQRLSKVLKYKGREDLSELLRHSVSFLEESSSYGSRWFSRLSTFEIRSHPDFHEKLSNLSEDDKKEIFDALLLIYPVKDSQPEITNIEYYPDFDIEINNLIETKELDRISFDYIHEQIRKCNTKVAEKDFDGAISNARSLLESICLFILESKNKQKYEYDGNLIKLYKLVASILRMSPGDYDDSNLKQILSGVFSIINGVSGLRNMYSDAHGAAPSASIYKIDERHAILTVNLSKTITEYLFLSYEKSEITSFT